MEQELDTQYDIPKQQSEAWIAANQILPLLDGLDEVEVNCRSDCVKAINTWLMERKERVPIAICCSPQVYRELEVRPRLRDGVMIWPLRRTQVQEHLARGGPSLEGLRTAIAEKAELRKLARSPLLLRLLEKTCRDRQPEEVDARHEEEVFEGYVKHALETRKEEERPPSLLDRTLPGRKYRRKRTDREPDRDRRYPEKRTRNSLAWLAAKMAHHPLLRVERLQPDWLDRPGEVWAYALSSRSLGGALLAFPVAWIYLSPALLLFGWLAGLFAGCLDALWMQRPAGSRGLRQAVGAHEQVARYQDARRRWRRIFLRPLARGIVVSAGTFFLLLLAGPLWRLLFSSGVAPAYELENRFRTGLLFAPLFGLVFGLRGAHRDKGLDVRIRERLAWRRWSWRAARLATVWSAAGGIGLSAVAALDPSLSDLRISLLPIPILAVSVVGGLVGGIVGGWGGKPLEERIWPNQGTWRTLGNAGVVALCVSLATIFALASFNVITLGVQVSDGTRTWELLGRDLWSAAKAGLALGFWAGLWFSGLDFVQHFTLRAILRLWRRVPAGLIDFLDHATERGLLQRPGGSYKFRHAQLKDWFAKSYKPPTS